ncbi:ABC transporter substrate-binding protein [Lutispora sp.]|uniref:ABC transporter substrate-binding protein n=1 Tax=Lutispora sp. TaxID=2828727 RepID=UPI002B2057E1|nr:ABC transporter substrate-binding protein [Lutispora sp.]MEA4961329.1 ABC transporter substrate-binding protein [Lutispora sp.]
MDRDNNSSLMLPASIAIIIAVIFALFNYAPVKKAPIVNTAGSTNNTNQRLIIGRANDSVTLDPASTTEMNSFKVTVNIFETLVKYEKNEGRIIPCLAESWNSSEDGLTWVFKLREGIRFHDGTDFNASAVCFNFHRWMDKDNPYHNGKFSYWNTVFGGFPGFVDSVKALSNHSLEIKLNKPYAPFLNALAMPAFGIAGPEAIKEHNEDLFKHPVGTGPFLLKSWEHNKSIILERNDKYWNGRAKVKEIEFRIIPGNKDRLEELKQGSIHIADYLSPVDIAEVKYDPNLHLYLRPSFNVGYIAMNNERFPFNKRDVRVAINHAIDKEKLVNDVFDNFAKPAATYIPPSLWGYNNNLKTYEYDPDKSRKLMQEAGFPNGFKTTLWVMDAARDYFPKPLQVAEFVKESLKQVGIYAEIKVFNWDEYLTRIRNGEHEIALIGWTGDYADPDNFLYTMFASENAKPGFAANYSLYKSKEADQLLIQARETTNMVFRRSLYRSLQEIVNYEAPSVPLVHTMPVMASRLSVRGYVPSMTGIESLENVELASE